MIGGFVTLLCCSLPIAHFLVWPDFRAQATDRRKGSVFVVSDLFLLMLFGAWIDLDLTEFA